MSHFSVLVIGADHAAQLQPFHEFECTGVSDQHVQDIDTTEERRAEFATATRSVVRLADGRMVGRHADICYREPTAEEKPRLGMGSGCGDGLSWHSRDWGDGLGYRSKVRYTPEGAEEIEVPFASFREYLVDYCELPLLNIDNPLDLQEVHKFGHVHVVNDEVVQVLRRTNPNKKWDWWEVGGRYGGRLVLKDGTRVDTAAAGDVDWAGMREARRLSELETHRQTYSLLGDRRPTSWRAMYAAARAAEKLPGAAPFDLDALRAAYRAQPGIVEIAESGLFGFSDGRLNDILAQPDGEAYAAAEGELGGCTWALLHGGEWTEQGEMGWFGFNDATNDTMAAYAKRFRETVEALPPETPVTVIDCHI